MRLHLSLTWLRATLSGPPSLFALAPAFLVSAGLARADGGLGSNLAREAALSRAVVRGAVWFHKIPIEWTPSHGVLLLPGTGVDLYSQRRELVAHDVTLLHLDYGPGPRQENAPYKATATVALPPPAARQLLRRGGGRPLIPMLCPDPQSGPERAERPLPSPPPVLRALSRALVGP
jgi:hypothetical protein